VLAALPLAAQAADLRQGSDLTVGSGETVNDDLYAAGGTITVNGTVNGNLIIAGGTVTVAGNVSRDVMLAGGTLTVNGHIDGSVRAAGGTITLNGPVANDLVVAGGTVTVGSSGTIGRDLVLAAGNGTVDGTITRNVLMGSGTLTLRNRVGGNVSGRVNQLRLDGAQVQGNLDYTSENEVQLVNGGKVLGTTTRHPVARNTTNGFVDWLRALIGILALGLIFLLVLPRVAGRSIDTLRAEPWLSLGIGAGILIITPIVGVIIFVIGLLVGGWWLGVLLLPLWILTLALGYVVSGFLLGRLVFAQVGWGSYHDALALAAGLLILAIVTVIPLLGWLIGLAAVVFGTGAFALALTRWAGRDRVAPPAASAPATPVPAT
jgi:cytoskeletal protein CcmA (bactofilin family)